MASIISAGTTSATALNMSADTTGILQLASNNGTVALTISTAQVVTFAKPPTATGGGSVATNTAYGTNTLQANTSGSVNTAVGYQAGFSNTTGTAQVAVGNLALDACTTGNRNTAVGDNALGALTTADNNTAIGRSAGLALTTGSNNTFVGAYNGSTGGSGEAITTGSKNTILGSYNGNQGGLDIRTASNYIVLSDGDGNPVFWTNGNFIQGSAFNSNRAMGNTDMNTVRTSGMYRFDNGTPNAPTGTFYSVVVYGNGDNVVAQLATVFQGSTTYTRSYNTSWSAWVQL